MLLFFIHNYCYYHNMIGSLRLPRRQQDLNTGLLSIIEVRAKYLRHMSLGARDVTWHDPECLHPDLGELRKL